MPKNPRAWRIATSAAKRKGYRNFKAGSPGDVYRKHVAEGVGRTLATKKRKMRRGGSARRKK